MLTGPSGLPLNGIFPIVNPLEFANFVQIKFLDHSQLGALNLLFNLILRKQNLRGHNINLDSNQTGKHMGQSIQEWTK